MRTWIESNHSPVFGMQGVLRRHGRRQRVKRRLEGGVKLIANRGEDVTVVALDRASHQGVVARLHLWPGIRKLAGQLLTRGRGSSLSGAPAFRQKMGRVGSIQVRMALHTGPAAPRGETYEGYLTLSHAKRLMSAAYGGQILLSEATEGLLRDPLPAGISLRNLGAHRLKDFERIERIFQVVAGDLPAEFPPLKTQSGSANNLPVQLTSFIGRSREVGEVRQLLAEHRLLTLTGPSGSGKTRLALQTAAESFEYFPDGAFFVALAPVSDPGLVGSTIAQALSLSETPGRSIVDSLKDYLRTRSLLLLLDNFEQVIAAAPLVADLLVACGELNPSSPAARGCASAGSAITRCRRWSCPTPTGCRLWKPSRSSRRSNCSSSAPGRSGRISSSARKPRRRWPPSVTAWTVCHWPSSWRAARIRLLPPRAMLARLEHRLEFLTGGARDLPARQQTLRNAIAWSYDLLNEEEQRLFRRLSIFVGGCTVEAVEEVAGDNPAGDSELDRLGSLLDKSLMQEAEGANAEPRFVMLETLREFGLEQLAASGEQEAMHRRHAVFFLALAEQAQAKLESAEQIEWMNRMEQEHGNLRAALEWSKTAQGMTETCLRLAGTLAKFWEVRGYFSEGRERLAALLLTEPAQGRTAARARLLARAAELAYRQSDYPATTAFATESLAIYRQVGDWQGTASVLIKLGNAAAEVGDYAAASGFLQEALNTWRDLDDAHGTARALISYGWAAMRSGDYPLAKARLAEALAISRGLGIRAALASSWPGWARWRCARVSPRARRSWWRKAWSCAGSWATSGGSASHWASWAGWRCAREIGSAPWPGWAKAWTCGARLATRAAAHGA